ncbi:hypothetical protein [Natronococcus jeotgali]|uniref:Uncharacterized protein n=1 Tax=Natronococcus jeotgali DSM 18795 TaxID=1227498 RepID=L9XXB9_9EURY|nr:hypothetical protein [Natronococcus jeotgali]ELY66061.1 hypothetical protein C492_01723 [Natronococcus jeotgali DSM 18795]
MSEVLSGDPRRTGECGERFRTGRFPLERERSGARARRGRRTASETPERRNRPPTIRTDDEIGHPPEVFDGDGG